MSSEQFNPTFYEELPTDTLFAAQVVTSRLIHDFADATGRGPNATRVDNRILGYRSAVPRSFREHLYFDQPDDRRAVGIYCTGLEVIVNRIETGPRLCQIGAAVSSLLHDYLDQLTAQPVVTEH